MFLGFVDDRKSQNPIRGYIKGQDEIEGGIYTQWGERRNGTTAPCAPQGLYTPSAVQGGIYSIYRGFYFSMTSLASLGGITQPQV